MTDISRRGFFARAGAAGLGGAALGLAGGARVAGAHGAHEGPEAHGAPAELAATQVHAVMAGEVGAVAGQEVRLRAERPRPGGLREAVVDDDAAAPGSWRVGDRAAIVRIGDRTVVAALYEMLRGTVEAASAGSVTIGGRAVPLGSPAAFVDADDEPVAAAAAVGQPAFVSLMRNLRDGTVVAERVLVG